MRDPDRARPGLAGPGARRGAARGLDAARDVGVLPARRRRVPRRRAGAAGGGGGRHGPGGLQRRQRGLRRRVPRRTARASPTSCPRFPACWGCTTYPRTSGPGTDSPSTTSSPPTRGRVTRPRGSSDGSLVKVANDCPVLPARRGALRGRHPGLDRPARARPHDPRQEVRREGHAVLHRLRPHRVVARRRRDRVRRQGDPARRLRQDRRHAAAGAEQLADEVTTDAQGNTVVRVRKSNTGMFTQLISDARAAEWETIKPEDSDRLFYKMPWWKKVIVMAGGPTVNIVIAFGIFAAVFSHLRQPQRRADLPGRGPGRGLRGPRGPGRTRLHRRGPGQPRGQGAACSRATGSSPSTARRITRLEAAPGRSSAATPPAPRRSPCSATGPPRSLTTNTMVTPRPTSATDRTLEPVGFLGCHPGLGVRNRRPGLHPRPDGHDDRADRPGARHRSRSRCGAVAKAIAGVEPARHRQPGQHRRRRPAGRRDRLRAGASRSSTGPSSC